MYFVSISQSHPILSHSRTKNIIINKKKPIERERIDSWYLNKLLKSGMHYYYYYYLAKRPVLSKGDYGPTCKDAPIWASKSWNLSDIYQQTLTSCMQQTGTDPWFLFLVVFHILGFTLVLFRPYVSGGIQFFAV